AFILVDVVDRADVGMVQSRGRARFTFESLESLCVASEFRRKKLQCDKATQTGILCFVDNTHSARAKLLNNAVLGDHPAGLQLHFRLYPRRSERADFTRSGASGGRISC